MSDSVGAEGVGSKHAKSTRLQQDGEALGITRLWLRWLYNTVLYVQLHSTYMWICYLLVYVSVG